MQQEKPLASGGQLADGTIEIEAVDGHEHRIVTAGKFARIVAIVARATRVAGGSLQGFSLAKMHQDGVHGHPMQPGGKTGIAAEGPDLSKKPQEYLLCEILGFAGVFQHAQTDAEHSLAVNLVKVFESRGIAILGPLYGFRFIDFKFCLLNDHVRHDHSHSRKIPSSPRLETGNGKSDSLAGREF